MGCVIVRYVSDVGLNNWEAGSPAGIAAFIGMNILIGDLCDYAWPDDQ
jgi:hypothetical protein